MAQTVISAQGLSKTYRAGFWKTRHIKALDGFNLEVYDNEIFGCLGPNGAGKSTTLKLLMSLIRPTSGRAEILGKSVPDVSIRHFIGYLPENPYFYEYLTAEEFLSFYASIFGYSRVEIRSRVDRFLKMTGIFHARKLQLRKFSKGMIQRVGIAQAIINDPRIVFLDEPMSGLDPIGRREVRDLILRLKREGRTIFFSTHILNDVETLCDRVAVLNRGKVIGSGLLTDLVSQEISHLEVVLAGSTIEKLREITQNAYPMTQSGTTVRMEVPAGSGLGELFNKIEQSSGKIVSVNPVKQTMEDYFFALVGKAREPEASTIT